MSKNGKTYLSQLLSARSTPKQVKMHTAHYITQVGRERKKLLNRVIVSNCQISLSQPSMRGSGEKHRRYIEKTNVISIKSLVFLSTLMQVRTYGIAVSKYKVVLKAFRASLGESLFLGFLKEDLFYFHKIIFQDFLFFSYFIILQCYSQLISPLELV